METDRTQLILDAVGDYTQQIVEPDTSLDDIGLDSLDLLGLIQAVENKTGGKFPQAMIPQLHTVKDFDDYLSS